MVIFLFVFVGNIFSNVFLFGHDFYSVLEGWAKMASIAGGFSIVVAVMGFLHQRDNDRAKYVVELLKFFRNDVLAKGDHVDRLALAINPRYDIHLRFKIEKFDLNDIRKNYPSELGLQEAMIIPANKNFNDEQIHLLNMLEEFALDVIYTDSISHEALNSVKAVFSGHVCKNVVAMLYLASNPANGTYPGITELYLEWNRKN